MSQMSTSQPGAQETAWCAGFQQSGVRELTPAELEELRALSARFQARGRVALGGTVAVVTVAALAAWLGGSLAWLVLALFIISLALPLGLMIAREGLVRARAFRQDAGWLRQFSGCITPSLPEDELRDRLVRRRLLFGDARPGQWFEVLPHSHLMWTANGYRVPVWMRTPPNVLAEVPEYAATAAQWVEPADQPGSEGIHLNFRELTTAERNEVRKHARKLMLRSVGGALLMTFWTGAIWLTSDTGDRHFGKFLVGGFAAWSWWNVVRILSTVGKLTRDAEHGRVVIIRRALSESGDPHRSPDLTPPDEFLPESGIPWTVAEKPASWRHSAAK
jgi:hypothetical protein